jgi:hypothetical protein
LLKFAAPSSVQPSAGWLSTKLVAMPPTAPGLLIGSMVQPFAFAISWPMMRITVSVPPPAAYMMTRLMGFAGHLPCAQAPPIVMTKPDAAAAPARNSRRPRPS